VPTDADGAPKPKAQRNFTDPDSRIMVKGGEFLQGYNAQAAIDAEAQVIVAVAVTNQRPIRSIWYRCSSRSSPTAAELRQSSATAATFARERRTYSPAGLAAGTSPAAWGPAASAPLPAPGSFASACALIPSTGCRAGPACRVPSVARCGRTTTSPARRGLRQAAVLQEKATSRSKPDRRPSTGSSATAQPVARPWR
jgi:hypothetical protein